MIMIGETEVLGEKRNTASIVGRMNAFGALEE